MYDKNNATGEVFCEVCNEPFQPETPGDKICPRCEDEIQEKANAYAHNII